MDNLIHTNPTLAMGLASMAFMAVLVAFEWRTGRYAHGAKTRSDWSMFGLSTAGIALVERPLLLAVALFVGRHVAPAGAPRLVALQEAHLALCAVVFLFADELVHGAAHNFAHARPPRNPVLARVHAFYREAHRPHHLVGGPDGRGQVSASHAVVAGWGWYLFLPNYWLGMAAVYLGLVDTWFWATLFKNLWGLHVHTNWSYDVYLLNHPNRFVRGGMRALCHVITFPNQHHHHHGRSRNSSKNMQNVLALYDWLLWKTLVIEDHAPDVYGWKQRPEDARVLRRYLARPLRVAGARR